MEWNARTPTLWDWDITLPCDAGNSWAGGASSSGSEMDKFSSTGSSPRAAADVVPSPVLQLDKFVEDHDGVTFFDQLDADSPPVPPAEAVDGRTEGSSPPPIGLKLGKRSYFEDASTAGQQPAALSTKKLIRECDQSSQHLVIYCQVEGCDVELSAAKEYYRKHRVCEDHTKRPRVIVAGQERRFCQQCSRFHELMEFDQKKRSCRRRLSDHNARRRKPQLDMISFCSSIFTLSTYDEHEDDARQISFLRDKTPDGNVMPGAGSAWGYLHDSKLPRTGSWPLMKNAEAQLIRVPNAQLPSTGRSALRSEVESTPPRRGVTAGVLNQISTAVSSASNFGGGRLDLPGVLSLVSPNPWPSSDVPGEITSPIPSDATASTTPTQSFMHTENSISAGHEYYWQNHGSSQSPPSQQTTTLSSRMQKIINSSQLEEHQVLHDGAALLHGTAAGFFNSGQMHPCW